MSVDKSLVSRVSMTRARNVYSRAERLEILKKDGRLEFDGQVLGLPKTRVEKMMKKVKAREGEEGRRRRGGGSRRGGSGRRRGRAGGKAPPPARRRRCRGPGREGRRGQEAREEVDVRRSCGGRSQARRASTVAGPPGVRVRRPALRCAR